MMDLNPTGYLAGRYTFDGYLPAEKEISRHQGLVEKAVLDAVPACFIEAIVLIGGYARGDGGYTLSPTGKPQPYNDYDYFIVFKGVTHARAAKLICQIDVAELEQEVGVEVDFFPLLKQQIATLEFSLMYAEMQAGHKVIYGNQDILLSMPNMPLAQVESAEFSRLLTNRGFLLLLNHSSPAADQFTLYINKAMLAVGDVILFQHDLYALSYREKLTRLKMLMPDNKLVGWYEAAVKAKYRPDLAQQWDRSHLHEATVLWLDTMDSLPKTSSLTGYLKTHSSVVIKHIVLNVMGLGLRTHWRNWLRHPRESVRGSLVKLLNSVVQGNPPAGAENLIPLWYRFS